MAAGERADRNDECPEDKQCQALPCVTISIWVMPTTNTVMPRAAMAGDRRMHRIRLPVETPGVRTKRTQANRLSATPPTREAGNTATSALVCRSDAMGGAMVSDRRKVPANAQMQVAPREI